MDVIFPGKTPVATIGSTRLPGNVDLALWQGDAITFDVTLSGEGGAPIDLAGLTPGAMIRESFTAPAMYEPVCTVLDGKVRVYLSSAVSKAMPAGNYVWNLQLTAANGDTRTYLAGDCVVHAEVDH